MFQPRIDCPHCGNRVDLAVSNLFEYRFKTGVPVFPHIRTETEMTSNRPPVRCYGSGGCPICDCPVLIVFEVAASDFIKMQSAAKESIRVAAGFVDGKYAVIDTFPKSPAGADDPAFPKKARALIPTIEGMVRRKESPELALAGCRSVLEVACKELGGEGRNLRDRIDDLLGKTLLTKPLAEWAHRLRLDGNAAVHEIEGTIEQAAELFEFMKLFLDVTFVLPKRIAERRKGD